MSHWVKPEAYNAFISAIVSADHMGERYDPFSHSRTIEAVSEVV